MGWWMISGRAYLLGGDLAQLGVEGAAGAAPARVKVNHHQRVLPRLRQSGEEFLRPVAVPRVTVVCARKHSFVRSFVRLFVLFIWSTGSFIGPFIGPFVHSLVHALNLSFVVFPGQMLVVNVKA